MKSVFDSFTFLVIGQYFAAVNTDKKEFVCPWCLGGVAKLWEWAANPSGAIFTWLLRKSTGSGGGDYQRRTETIDLSGSTPEETMGEIKAFVAREGEEMKLSPDSVVDRWAEDSVALVGDYDESELWYDLYGNKKTYRNISEELVETWNDFIEIDRMKLEYDPCSSCQR